MSKLLTDSWVSGISSCVSVSGTHSMDWVGMMASYSSDMEFDIIRCFCAANNDELVVWEVAFIVQMSAPNLEIIQANGGEPWLCPSCGYYQCE